MNWSGLLVQTVSVALEAWILVLVWRRGLWHPFPLFTGYVAYDLLRTLLASATISRPHLYFYVYWITAPGEMLLMILAASESFYKVFRSFYLLWWFRILFPGAIIGALVYSAWQGYVSPPVQASAAGGAIISAAVTAQYVILAIAALFFGLAIFLHIPPKIYEYRFVLGIAVSSLAVAFGGTVRSRFGTNFRFLGEMLPAVAYIGALLVWLSAVRHPQPAKEKQLAEAKSAPQVIAGVRRQSEFIRAFLRKG